jgi:hypothetical protein
MTLGQILFELRATQKRTDGRKDGGTRVNLNPPPLKWGHKKAILMYESINEPSFPKYMKNKFPTVNDRRDLSKMKKTY